MKKKSNVGHILFLILIIIIFAGAWYVNKKLSSTNFEEVLFYLKTGSEDSDYSTYFDAIKTCFPILIISFIILYGLFYDITFGKIKKQIYPIKHFQNHKKLYTWILFSISFYFLLCSVDFFDFVKNSIVKSDFIENNYVDSSKVNIEFNEKRNLVFIVVESLETSLFSKEHGGYWDYEVTPELYELLNDEDAVVFYNKNKAQGMNMIQGASFTTSSIIATSTGLPFKFKYFKSAYSSSDFMNNIYALGDLLSDNGYYNEIISGAKTTFGGIGNYLTKHGNYEIIDANTLNKHGLKMEYKDKGAWGFNDNYLFEIAKQRLELMSGREEPFNLELITIDTHFIDGFVGDYSETKYKEQYENAYATTSRLIYDFVEWIKEQDFYKNTTIVIVGDHLSMQDEFFKRRGAKVENRYIYNCIINPINKSANTSNRVFTALDMYPTIVYSIGGNIDGDILGLGVNLFSEKETLSEKYGLEVVRKELKKRSKFYEDNVLKKGSD